jgi:putative flippase GtrA
MLAEPDIRGSRPRPQRAPVVDVCVPVHNEAHVLRRSIERLHDYLRTRFPFSWRITIVDNASTDATPAIGGDLAARHPDIRPLRLERKGRGFALRTAWTSSDAQIVAYTDVDLSTDLDALLPLVAPLVSGHSDVAVGCRLAPWSSVARGPKRELISRVYNLLLRVALATRIRDAQCGFKAMRADLARRILPAVRDDEWFFDTELLVLSERNGLRIHELPVDWIDDPDSRVDIVDTAWKDIRHTIRMAWTFASGKGHVDLGDHARPTLRDDLGRRALMFASIGTVSTLVSLALFLALRGPLGPVAANAAAVSTTFVANTWANARLTLRVARPRWLQSLVVYAGSLALTTAALVAVTRARHGSTSALVALASTWGLTSAGRFVLMSRDAVRGVDDRPSVRE